MKTIGIVAEYNPFHTGHEYHIRKTRELAGEECRIICVMSGDFVQRGEAAIYSKYARAESACRCGADLAVELPLPWALSSAEGFARGAVGLLRDLGCTHISFGSECGDLEALEALAVRLIDPMTDMKIRQVISENPEIPYAAARQRALEALGADAKLLETPNNILAVEYIKAIYELRSDLVPMTVKRSGAAHDSTGGEQIKSASELRTLIRDGRDVSAFLPENAVRVYEREQRQGRGPANEKLLDTAQMARLRMLPRAEYDRLPDSDPGLASRLYASAFDETTAENAAAAAKTKRYALSRIRRMYMCACLGVRSGMSDGTPPYARVLAFNDTGREILHALSRDSVLPIITKPAAGRELRNEAAEIYELTAAAHDFYVLGCPAVSERRGGADWRTSPIFVNIP